jgi:glycosyltransferase involved in cell wall biosynthesis
MKLSFVIPVYNEEESLRELHSQISHELETSLKAYDAEIIFVDDGSRDGTKNILLDIERSDPRVRVLVFRRNLGKAAALNVGFSRVTGDLVVTMDGDLQDGPENIRLMLEELNKGNDLVVGWKKKRHDPLGKTLPSKLFNKTVSHFSKLDLHDVNSGLKLMRTEVVGEMVLYGEMHRFVPVLASQRGFKVSEVAVAHHPRKYGSSKYGWERLFKGFLDFSTVMFLGRFGKRPLHLFGLLGAISMFAGIIFGSYLVVIHFMGGDILRPLLNLVLLLVIAGLQLFATGLIAEMIVSRPLEKETPPISYETKSAPPR